MRYVIFRYIILDIYILCGLLEAGMSIRNVAQRLSATTRTIQKWWDKFQKEGNVDRKIGSGRPSITTDKQKADLVLSVKRNRFKPVTKLGKEWINRNELTCSLRTARRIVFSAGYKSCYPAIRIPLGHYHRVVRLQLNWFYCTMLMSYSWRNYLIYNISYCIIVYLIYTGGQKK